MTKTRFYLAVAAALLTLLPLSAHAQRSGRGGPPASPFTAVTPDEMKRSIDLLGVRLGMTLAQVKSIVEGQGGEVFWRGSPDPTFTRTREQLQRGSNSYFSYEAHSIPRSAYKVPGKKGQSRRRPDLGRNIKISMAFYPVANAGLKDPNNLVLYYMMTHTGFQPSNVELMKGRAKIVPITTADYNTAVLAGGYHLTHLEQGTFIYVQGPGANIPTGDLSQPLRQWTVQRERKQLCVKLMTEASGTAKTAGALAPVMVQYDQATGTAKKTYIAYRDRFPLTRLGITFDKLAACGTVSLTKPITRSSQGVLNGEVLNSVSVQHTSAQAIADAHEGLFNALHR